MEELQERERERLEWAIRCVKMEIENPGSSGQQLAEKLKRRGIIAYGWQLQLELDAQRGLKFHTELGELRADTTILLTWQWPKAANEVADETCCPHGCKGEQSRARTKQYRSIEAVLDDVIVHDEKVIDELRAMRQERPDEIVMMVFDARGPFTIMTAGSRQDGEVSKKTMLAIAKARLTVGAEPPEDKDKKLLEWPCPDVPS